MLVVPEECVTVMLELARSRMTVSLEPAVGPEPAAPGSRGLGMTPGCGVSWPAGVMGVGAGCPLFQLDIVAQSPLESFIHTAGTRLSLRASMSPCETLTSTGEMPVT